ncbi:DUF2637 domain-containing protein [Actinomadura rugatobispora]|uniref:DUF2637 domain-containing protein n=1 Tax=Actinomadura rugatobispora TaxID=1994 RepID=A0ABW0ZVM9_9ACTN|nr:hypothetical protein GCM10010200_036780 [Actinomadura rugatobispora]
MTEPTKRRVTGRHVGYTTALAAGVAVFASGTATSFANLARYAREHGWIWGPALPLGLDLGIFALLLLDWLRPSAFLRTSAWVLTAGTVLANYAVTDGDRTDRALHAIVILVAVIIFEAARHLRDDDSTRMGKIRLSRWALSPIRTARLWRRMVLWEITSYSEALTRESAILHARTVLTAHYGKQYWITARRKVPLTLRHQLATGQIPSSVLLGLDTQDAVRAWVREALAELTATPSPDPVEGAGSGEVPAEDSAAPEPNRWDLIWDLQDSLRPDGVPAEVFAQAIGLARHHFEQVGTHMRNEDLAERLRIAKARANAIGKVIRTSHSEGPDLQVRTQDSDQVPTPAVEASAAEGWDLGGESGPEWGLTGPLTNGRALATRAGES